MKTSNTKQVAAFEKLLGHCNAQGAKYKPSKASIESTALKTLLAEAHKSILTVHNAQTDLVDAINHRNRLLDTLPEMGTRVMSALDACDAPKDLVKDVNRIRKKFRYVPAVATAKKKRSAGQAEQIANGNDVPTSVPGAPVSELDIKSKISNLTKLITLLKKEPSYTPNESDLSVEGLEDFLERLRDKDQVTENAAFALKQERQKRNGMFFKKQGIYGISKMVKMYFRSLFGHKSTEYKNVVKIQFLNK